MLPIDKWKSGWSKKAMKKYRVMCKIPDNLESLLKSVFKGWNDGSLVFRGRHDPRQWQDKMNFKQVPGWSDFYLKEVQP